MNIAIVALTASLVAVNTFKENFSERLNSFVVHFNTSLTNKFIEPENKSFELCQLRLGFDGSYFLDRDPYSSYACNEQELRIIFHEQLPFGIDLSDCSQHKDMHYIEISNLVSDKVFFKDSAYAYYSENNMFAIQVNRIEGLIGEISTYWNSDVNTNNYYQLKTNSTHNNACLYWLP